MLGDQSFNADKYVRHGIGKKVLMDNFEEETFKNSVETVLNDKRFVLNLFLYYRIARNQMGLLIERSNHHLYIPKMLLVCCFPYDTYLHKFAGYLILQNGKPQ